MRKEVEDSLFIDSSIFLFGAGEIGYRWAVKVLYLIATQKVKSWTSTLFYQELLDRFYYLNDRERSEILFKESKKLIMEVEPILEVDFDRSFELFKKYPNVSPRVLFQTAVVVRKKRSKICATFATGIEHMNEVRRINLMESIGEVSEFCS